MTSQLDPQDQDIINKCIPWWSRAINAVYEVTFAPLDRLVEYLGTLATRNMVADFEARQARKNG
jgi:hypothetical protein